MNWFYTKIMTWLIGEAEANSSRIKIALGGIILGVFALVSAKCAFCQSFLTPELADKIAGGIITVTIMLIGSITKRDIAAPGQIAGSDGSFPPPPALPDGVPDLPPLK